MTQVKLSALKRAYSGACMCDHSPLPHTCYVLHTGDGHSAVFVDALAAPGQFLALLIPLATLVNINKVGSPLL